MQAAWRGRGPSPSGWCRRLDRLRRGGPRAPLRIHGMTDPTQRCRDILYRMSKSRAEAGFTIGAVAARTGLSVPVLRSWEQRFGFPRPAAARRRAPALRRGRGRAHPAGGRRRARRAARSRRPSPWRQRSPEQAPTDGRSTAPCSPASAAVGPTSRSRCSAAAPCSPSATPSRTSAWPKPTSPPSPGPSRRVEAYRAGPPPLARARPRREPARSCSPTSPAAAPATACTRWPSRPSAPLAREWSVICDAAVVGRRRWPGGSGPTASSRRCGPSSPTSSGWPPSSAASSPLTTRPASPSRPHRRAPLDHATGLRRATAVTNRAIAYLDR